MQTNKPMAKNAITKIFYRISKFSNIAKMYVEFEYLRRIKKVDNRYIGKWTKDNLVEMGPTFVKIGQFLSSRSDIFGEEIIAELKELQDNVLPLSYDKVKDSLIPILDVTTINEVPIAAASIGQVHLGATNSGNEIVVKIKRPKIEEKIEDDFETLLFCVNILKKLSDDRKIKEFEILFKEYYNLLKEEIDFKREAQNMIKFRKAFASKTYVQIPVVYPKYSDSNIITMEYVPSIKIDDVQRLDELSFNREKIAQKLIELFIRQVVEFGMVHIDPHPGNVGVTKAGKIVFYDFGMILDLDPKIKKNFTSFLTAVYDRNVSDICDIAIEMGLVVIEPKDVPFFKTFLISFLSYVESADLEEFKVSYVNKLNVNSTPFLISSKFVLLLRGISILEGVCKKLDPNFNFRKTLDPYINEFIVDVDYFEKRAMKDVKKFTSMTDNMQVSQIQLEVLERNMKEVENDVKQQKSEKYFILIVSILTVFTEQNYNCGALTATICGLTYSILLNGKVYK